MINKEQLEQLHHLKKEIEILKDQINSFEPKVVKDSVVGSSISYPYTQHIMVITGLEDYDKKLERLQLRLADKMYNLLDTVEKLNEYIETVADSEMRQILTLRYVKNLSWQQVASHMGKQGDGSTERKKCDRFLEISLNS